MSNVTKYPNEFMFHSSVPLLISAYEYPDDKDEWLPCPHCTCVPKIWVFDNGISTGCGCHNSLPKYMNIQL